MKFDIKTIGRKNNRAISIVELLKSPAIMALGFSTIFLSCDPNELCNGLKLLLELKQAGNYSNLINEEIAAMVDKLMYS